MSGLTERCAKQMSGVLGCLDRVVIQGTLPTSCDADGMTRFLNARHVRIFDDFDFTKPLKEGIRQNAERIAGEAGLDRYAARFCPVTQTFGEAYHWSLMQAEYATDIVFGTADDLAPVYEEIIRTAIHAVKADQVATFFGKKLHGNYEGEMGTHFHTRIEGTRIKHHAAGKAALKMYDKFGRILRIETTVNDVGFFRHYRRVEHRDGTSSMKQAPVKKTIDSLPVLIELCSAANRRYLDFISELQDPSDGIKQMRKIARPARDNGRSYRGFNLLAADDHKLFLAIARGEHNISGMTNRTLQKVLSQNTSAQISRQLKRLRTHGLIKKVGRTYQYDLTTLGRATVMALLKIRQTIVLPTLAQTVHC